VCEQVEPDDVLALALAVRLAANVTFPFSTYAASKRSNTTGVLQAAGAGAVTALANAAVGRCLPCGSGAIADVIATVVPCVGERIVEGVAAKVTEHQVKASDPGPVVAPRASTVGSDLATVVLAAVGDAVTAVARYLGGVHMWT
jgi:hypothetical protein